MKKKYLFLITAFIILLAAVAIWHKKKTSPSQELPVLNTAGKNPLVKNIKTLTNNGGRVDWSPKGDLIAFDRMGEDGYYDVWLIKPDGTEQKCLTCNYPQLPKHNGQPAWHPSGKYLVFQAQDPKLKGLPLILSKAERALTGPGAGVNNNLWLADSEGKKFWQLTHITKKKGLLHPHFTHDGQKLMWSELVDNTPKPGGQWVIKIADFKVENSPLLFNIKEYQPGKMKFYETHGFFNDGQRILFSATPDGYFKNLDIYVYDLETENLANLTNTPGQWDEHVQLSPNQTKIVWMSSQNIPQEIEQYKVVTDYWIMDVAGTNKERLTYFNDPSAPEYLNLKDGLVAADNSWSPDGSRLAVYLFDRQKTNSFIVILNLASTSL